MDPPASGPLGGAGEPLGICRSEDGSGGNGRRAPLDDRAAASSRRPACGARPRHTFPRRRRGGCTLNLDVRWTPVRFERVTGESSLSAVVEGSLTLPVGSPPIHRIVRATAAPRLTDVQASNGEVTLEGVVDVSLLYAVSPEETDWSAASGEDDGDDAYDDGPGAFMPREALHRALWLRELPFHGVVAVPGAASGGDVIPKVDVEEVKAYADGDGRTAHVDVVLTASVRVVAPEEAAVPEMA